MQLSEARLRAISLAAAIAVSIALVATAVIVVERRDRDVPRGNPLGNPPGMVDRLIFLDRPDAWLAGAFEDAKIDGEHLTLAPSADADYPRRGRWTSPQTKTDFPFTELIPSWNALVPAGAGLAVECRVRDATNQAWSPWLYFGQWGQVPPATHVVRFGRGAVYTDTLLLNRPADAWQIRATLASFSFDPASSPSLRRIAMSYSGAVADDAERARLAPAVKVVGDWARKLDVPYRTQRDAPKALRPQTCSPTSVSMVLEYWGYDRPTLENALAIYDPEHQDFGNWNRAVQRAGELGADAWVTRFRSWDAVKAQIALGRPVIASIRFGEHEFPAAAIESSLGHLIVICGFTPQGDAIVNDPASRKKGNGAIYPASQLARAWFDKGGVGYVIAGPRRESETP